MPSASTCARLCRTMALVGAALSLPALAFALMSSAARAQAVAADPLPQRVVTFGTSLTALGGWQPMLQEELRRCFGPDLVVLNEGEAGKGSA